MKLLPDGRILDPAGRFSYFLEGAADLLKYRLASILWCARGLLQLRKPQAQLAPEQLDSGVLQPTGERLAHALLDPSNGIFVSTFYARVGGC